MACRRSCRKDIKMSTRLQHSESLICSSRRADLTSPRPLLRSLSEAMIAALSVHLSQAEQSGGDCGESEEEDGKKEGARKRQGGGEWEKVEVVGDEEGKGVEARSPTNYRGCQTTQFCRCRGSRVGRGLGWSHEEVVQGWELRQEPRRGCLRFQVEGQNWAPPFPWPHTRLPLSWTCLSGRAWWWLSSTWDGNVGRCKGMSQKQTLRGEARTRSLCSRVEIAPGGVEENENQGELVMEMTKERMKFSAPRLSFRSTIVEVWM
jgi:hypothetical protein